MKKIKLDSEEFLRPVINYMLREYNADYESVKKKPIINGVPWYEYYWDTPESKKEFLDFLESFLKKNVNYKPHPLKQVLGIIDLQWGLKVYEDVT